MPFAIILIVGLVVYNTGVIDKVKKSKKETVAEIVTQEPPKQKPSIQEVTPVPKQPEPVKEEVKVEIKQPEPIKEEVKAEIKQAEPAQEVVKEEPTAEQEQTTTEKIKIEETESNYLKIILYIVGAIATIFGGFYFFSNRGGGGTQTTTSTADTARSSYRSS